MLAAGERAVSPLIVADFKGDVRARAARHGELFADRIRESGIIDFYRDYCERHLLAHGHGSVKAAVGLLHSLCARRLSPEAREAVAGFSAAGGFDERLIAQSLAMPDVLNYLIGFGAKWSRRISSLGCTSAAAWGDYAKDGKLRYARNLDFPGNGIWDRFPLVSRHRPDRGIPYVTVGAAGSFLDGITGINQEGLTVALHQHISTDVAILSNGRPILDLAWTLLNTCRNMNEAVELARSWTPTSCWTVVLTHWKDRQAAAVELTPSRSSLQRHVDGLFVRANDFEDPSLKTDELDYPAWRESSRLRVARGQQILRKNKGSVDAAVMAGLVGDLFDIEQDAYRALGQTITQPHNMTSVVFEPEDGVLWAAEGQAPACQGPYRRVPLWEEKPAGEFLEGLSDPLLPHQRKAFQSYLGGVAAWQRERNPGEACKHLAQSTVLDPAEPIYRYLHGLVALTRENVPEALESFSAGASLPDFSHRRSAQRLWSARCHDIQEERSKAVAIYEDLSENISIKPSVRTAAKKGLSSAFSRDELTSIKPDFFHFDVYKY